MERDSFLYSQLINYCNEDQVRRAVETRPAMAGVPVEVVDQIANSCINNHVLRASGISFMAGLPGGWATAITIPADLAQFYGHATILAQKLAYLYGWPDLLEEGEVDEETELRLTLLIGAMMGAKAAQKGLIELAERLAVQVAHRLPRQALTQYAAYTLAKQVGKWIGVNVTKTTFARGISKVVPFVGGVASATVTVVLMRPMAKKLQKHLKTLRYASTE